MSTNAAAGDFRGPLLPSNEDLDALNNLFSDAFTDRYRRDGLTGVRVPRLNRLIWEYAIQDAGDGAMVWYDERGQMVAFNIAHHSGTEGWMGPLVVRPDRQSGGLGKVIVSAALDWLRSKEVTTIGLETMPRTVENIGFYAKLGFVPGHLTITMTMEAQRRDVSGSLICLGGLPDAERLALVARCRDRLDASAPGYDYTREMAITHELGIGDTVVIERGGSIRGFALWHSAPLTAEGEPDEVRILKVFADSLDTFEHLVLATEQCAVDLGLCRIAIRCQTVYSATFRALVRLGCSVRWTDLRMVQHRYPEAHLADDEVLFSNWEI